MTPLQIERAPLLAALAHLEASLWTAIDETRHVYPELFEASAAGPYGDLDPEPDAASNLHLVLRLLRSVLDRYRRALAKPDSPGDAVQDSGAHIPW